MQPKHPAVVVTHGSGVNALGILRSLGRRGVETHLIAKAGSNNLAAHSRFCTHLHWMDEERPELLERILDEIARGAPAKPVLYCDSDEAMHLATGAAERLSDRFILTNTLARIPELQDKQYQAERARLAGIPVPRSWYLDSWSDLEAVKTPAGRKLIVKPNPSVFTDSAPFKIFFASDAADVRAQLETYVDTPRGMIVQEFIEGDDEHMWVVSGYKPRHEGPLTMVTMAKVKQSGTGAGGVGIIVEVRENERLKELTRKLLTTLDYQGAFAIEFKYSEADRDFYFIETNYRTARIHVLGRRKGGDLPAIMYQDVARAPGFASDAVHVSEAMWYYDMLSCLKTFRSAPSFRERQLILKHIVCAPFRHREWAVHASDDYQPTVASAKLWVKSTFAGLGRRIGVVARPARKPGLAVPSQ